MTYHKIGCHIVFSDGRFFRIRTSEVRAAHFMVAITPADTSAHVSHRNTDVWAGVVVLGSNIRTVLIRIVTLQSSIGVVAASGHGQLPTFNADDTIITPPPPTVCPVLLGAGSPRWDAAVLIREAGLEWVR